MTLERLVRALRTSPGVALKRDIQRVAELLPAPATGSGRAIQNGDDAAAIPDGDGYLLIAAEGMLPSFVAADPWFAGFCAVMVNASDIAAMGGRPYAVVDVLFAAEFAQSSAILRGLHDASRAFGVPVVGGHTSRLARGDALLAAAIVGRAQRLITSFAAQPGDELVLAVDLAGHYRPGTRYFDAATRADGPRLRGLLALLPSLAEDELVQAGKDVSMAGLAGTLTMLCEGSGTGAWLDLESLPRPSEGDLLDWLLAFPSFGYVLAVAPDRAARVHARCAALGVTSARVGYFDDSRRVKLARGSERALFWDLTREPLTGFGPRVSAPGGS